jgi:hypothetical protein
MINHRTLLSKQLLQERVCFIATGDALQMAQEHSREIIAGLLFATFFLAMIASLRHVPAIERLPTSVAPDLATAAPRNQPGATEVGGFALASAALDRSDVPTFPAMHRGCFRPIMRLRDCRSI